MAEVNSLRVVAHQSQPPHPQSTPPRILLVDDQPARLLTYEAILEGVGVECVRAHSGREALERLLQQQFAVIILDVSMPEMDGFETAALIREHPRYERTPLIFVTGIHISELDRARGYEVGAIDYIQIPIVPEILRSKVALLVELYRRRTQLELLNRELEEAHAKLELERNTAVAAHRDATRENEERYRAIFEHPTELIVVLNAVRDSTGTILDWRYLDANTNSLQFLGRSRQELLGRTLTEVVAERSAGLMHLYQQVLLTRKPHSYEDTVGERTFLRSLFPIGENTIVSSAVDITDRTAAETQIRRTWHADRAEKEWFAAVLNSMNEEVYFADPHKRFTYANPAALREFGQSGDMPGAQIQEFVGRLEVLRPDGTPRCAEEAPASRALAGELVREEEEIVRLQSSGELRFRQVSSAPVRDAKGEIIGSVTVVRDITEKKRIEASLRSREARSNALVRLSDLFRNTTEPAELAYAAARILGETLNVSRCGYGTIDLDQETISIERDWNAPGIDTIAGMLRFREHGTYIEDLKQGKTVVCDNVELDPRTAPHAERLKALQAWSFVNMPITEQTGTVAMLYLNHARPRSWTDEELAFIRDVADRTRFAVERRRYEQALALDHQFTQLLRDLAMRLVSDADVSTLLREILDAAITIAGADAGTIQLLEEGTCELVFATTRGLPEELTSRFERVSAASGTSCGLALASGARAFVDFDSGAPDPDGSLDLHRAHGLRSAQSTPLFSRAGRPLGMFSTHWREHCRLDERRLRFLDLLARQAADLIERTQAARDLRLSEQQLRESDRRKDEFIAVLAHELRNPLVPIRTGIELLKKANDTPTIVNSIRPIMERQIEHMVRLIDELLDVSRVTSGRMEIKRQSTPLTTLVGAAVEAHQQAITAGGLELSVNLSEPHHVLYVDPTRFAQVLSNLLHNAVKFTPTGGKITLTGTFEPASNGSPARFRLTVADTGVGISPAALPRIFELFCPSAPQGDASRGGLGIGLGLARRIVELHGGTLQARSGGIGHGSEFTLQIPVDLSQAAANNAELEKATLPHNLRVLIIEDNLDAAQSMKLLMESCEVTPQVEHDGLSGIANATAHEPDVVLLDIGMPGMNGYATCHELRRRHGSRVVIIALTGWGQEKDRQKALDAGFDAHLTKPVNPAILLQTISKHVQLRSRVDTNTH